MFYIVSPCFPVGDAPKFRRRWLAGHREPERRYVELVSDGPFHSGMRPFIACVAASSEMAFRVPLRRFELGGGRFHSFALAFAKDCRRKRTDPFWGLWLKRKVISPYG